MKLRLSQMLIVLCLGCSSPVADPLEVADPLTFDKIGWKSSDGLDSHFVLTSHGVLSRIENAKPVFMVKVDRATLIELNELVIWLRDYAHLHPDITTPYIWIFDGDFQQSFGWIFSSTELDPHVTELYEKLEALTR